jgi:hypothetical protein
MSFNIGQAGKTITIKIKKKKAQPASAPPPEPSPTPAPAPTNNIKPKFNINQELNNIKSQVITQLQNNAAVTFTENIATIIKDNAEKVVTKVTKELNPIYKKANKTFQPIEAYYKQLEQQPFKKEMKPLLVDTYIPIDTLLEAKENQINKIRQAEMMLDLIEFQIEKHNFTRRALEAIKEEAENTTLSKPPTLKRVNSNSSLYPQPPTKKTKIVVEEDEEEDKEEKQVVVKKTLTAGGGSNPKPAVAKPAVAKPAANPVAILANAKAAVMGDMLKSPLFLRKQTQHTNT